jgi:2-dehydropantoate 2-reductase
MHVAVVGAGAIGCFLAARLSEGGHAITLVGRPEQADAINAGGLLLTDPQRGERRYRLRAVRSLSERPDLVLLTVKTQDVAQACQDIRPFVMGVPVVAMQNGLQGDHLAAEVLGREAVVGAVVMCAASYLRPGEVTIQFPGWLIVGEPFGAAGARTRAIARVLGGAVPTYLTQHLARVRWSKLIANLNNALCAATGLPLAEIVHAPCGPTLAIRLMKEGSLVARAAGVRLDHGLYGLTPRALRQDPNAALIALLHATMTAVLAVLPERAAERVLAAAGRSRLSSLPVRGSTWQSIVRGRPSEVDYLNGEIVRLGRRLGIPTPFNSHIVDVVHAVERSHTFWRVEELVPPGVSQRAGAAPAATVRSTLGRRPRGGGRRPGPRGAGGAGRGGAR